MSERTTNPRTNDKSVNKGLHKIKQHFSNEHHMFEQTLNPRTNDKFLNYVIPKCFPLRLTFKRSLSTCIWSTSYTNWQVGSRFRGFLHCLSWVWVWIYFCICVQTITIDKYKYKAIVITCNVHECINNSAYNVLNYNTA